jgi:hypothetical protein
MDDVKALTTIVNILKNLDEESQARVLTSVHAFLGLGRSRFEQLPIAQDVQEVSVSNQPSLTFSEDRTMSPKEFVRNKEPTSDVERVACLAYYLAHYRGTPHFKTVDISTLNIEAAQPKFSNASVAVDNARARGLLVPSTKGNKQLSAIGEKFVELLPDREAARAAMASRLKRTAKKAKK